ncbi:MAG: 30S ribosomal protein S9, partial [Candidatus Omnitrophica bacterium]|nr:30S ribosomal protein S9 [Candidatus Omnitrophota bacterium]
GEKGFVINGRDFDDYVRREGLRMVIRQPLEATHALGRFRIRATVTGGGESGQAGAIRHGISRALLKFDASLRSILRKGGFLTRDPRMRERKKFGRKGARRGFQYTKR